jgi:glutamine amidotransferase
VRGRRLRPERGTGAPSARFPALWGGGAGGKRPKAAAERERVGVGPPRAVKKVTIALIDYGAGNLTSVRKGFEAAGAELFTPPEPAALAGASAIVVPGVGHFGATAALDDAWRSRISEAVAQGKPLLGICLGMQWLFEGSEEAADLRGLGAIPGVCARLASDDATQLKVPHTGWNSIRRAHASRLLDGVEDGSYVYFTHSYAAPVTDACVASTTHGREFAAVVEKGNVFGVQFHPEKSSDAGLRMLSNFVNLARAD